MSDNVVSYVIYDHNKTERQVKELLANQAEMLKRIENLELLQDKAFIVMETNLEIIKMLKDKQ